MIASLGKMYPIIRLEIVRGKQVRSMGRRSGRRVATLLDKYVLFLLEELKDPTRRREFLFSLCLDIALKSEYLAERKNFELIASLITFAKGKKFISLETLEKLRKEVATKFRDKSTISSGTRYDFTPRELQKGELSVLSFISEKAWKGLGGFDDDGSRASTTSKVKIKRIIGIVEPMEQVPEGKDRDETDPFLDEIVDLTKEEIKNLLKRGGL